jgi:hypothetical protein
MTTVTVFQNDESKYTGFKCSGHSGYADAGQDIVCAAISILIINTINSIESFTDDGFTVNTDEDAGLIECTFNKPAGHDSELLIRAMVLGLEGIRDTYGNEYLILKFREV